MKISKIYKLLEKSGFKYTNYIGKSEFTRGDVKISIPHITISENEDIIQFLPIHNLGALSDKIQNYAAEKD